MKETPQCQCSAVDANYHQFLLWRELPCDETDGRFADVRIDACVDCARLWLRYFVEYEAFSKSGRWARGLIEPARAETIRSDEVPSFLAALPRYIRGGSYFSQPEFAAGPMRWNI